MPDATKRILTDETGQDIVTAINNLVNAVDPTGSADAATTAASNANAAATAANTAATNAERVNITQSKSNHVITIQTTNKSNVNTTTTIQEPTASFTSNDGNISLSITTGDGTQTVTIPDPNKEHYSLAHKESVSRAKTRSGNPIQIEDAVNEIADKLVVHLEPVQDLHGYSKPWVGGAGKNKLDISNYAGATSKGITATNNGDGSISITGTATALATFSVGTVQTAGTYILNGTPSGGGTSSYRLDVRRNTSAIAGSEDEGNGSPAVQLEVGDVVTIRVANGYAVPTGGITLWPMLRISSVTDATFEPYANICPISGHDTVTVKRHGESNLCDGVFTDNKYVTASGSTATINSGYKAATNYIRVKENTEYSISGIGLNSRGTYSTDEATSKITYYKSDNTVVTETPQSDAFTTNSFTFTTPPGTAYIRFHCGIAATDVVVNEGKPEFAFYPISVSTAVNGNTPAGTVYGGTLTLNADGSGKIDVDGAMFTLNGTETWATEGRNNSKYYSMQIGSLNTYKQESVISDSFPYAYITSSTTEAGIRNFDSSGYSNARIGIRLNDVANTTLDTLIAILTAHPVQVCVKLVTPVTYTLTANQVQTLLGYNYVTCDSGEIDLSYRAQSLASVDTLLAQIPTGTVASSDLISISDGADGLPLKNLTINIEPMQSGSGTPSPTNIRPISGWDAVPVKRIKLNILKNSATSGTVSNVTVTVNADGTVKLNGTANADGIVTIASGVKVAAGKSYRLSGCKSGGEFMTSYWLQFEAPYNGTTYYEEDEGDGAMISNLPAAMTATISIQFKSGTAFSNAVFSPMLCPYFGSNEGYEPYTEKIYTIDLPSSAGTVYGGTITLDENGEGTLTVDCGIKDIKGTESGYTGSTSANANGRGLIYTDLSDIKAAIDSVVMSDKAQIVSSHTNSGISGLCVSGRTSVAGYAISIELATIGLTSSATASQIVTALVNYISANNFQIVYKLATPVTYSLTADQVKTLLGTNIISSDAGNVEVTYFVDINTKINSILNQINNRMG